jgi:type IV pilus assembly protein PilF
LEEYSKEPDSDFFRREGESKERANMNPFKAILLLATLLVFLGGCATSEQDRQKASIHSGLGYQHLQQGNATSALREFLEAEKLNPKDPTIQFALGAAYNAKGHFQEGLEHYRKALELDPKYTEAHNAMGATYLELGQWDDAIHEFNLVLQDDLYLTPFYALNNLGQAYYRKGDRAKAIECYKRALAMKPDFGLAYYNLGMAYKDNNQTKEAMGALRSALTYAPTFLDAHFQLGVLFFNAGKHDQARTEFEEVVRLAPRNEDSRLAQHYLDLLKKSGK